MAFDVPAIDINNSVKIDHDHFPQTIPMMKHIFPGSPGNVNETVGSRQGKPPTEGSGHLIYFIVGYLVQNDPNSK